MDIRFLITFPNIYSRYIIYFSRQTFPIYHFQRQSDTTMERKSYTAVATLSSLNKKKPYSNTPPCGNHKFAARLPWYFIENLLSILCPPTGTKLYCSFYAASIAVHAFNLFYINLHTTRLPLTLHYMCRYLRLIAFSWSFRFRQFERFNKKK